jgi:transcriptional regulator with PAS, ATPase and Fis domain
MDRTEKREYDDLSSLHPAPVIPDHDDSSFEEPIQESEIIEESLSLRTKEIDLIKKALEKHNGKRKDAARELGISERTLYRKIKEYDIKG